MRLLGIYHIVQFVTTAVVLITAPAYADQPSENKSDAIAAILSEYDFEDAPGIAIGVVQNGDVTVEEYRGIANLEYGIPIDEDTRFNIASNAKQYTALMVLELADQGSIDLDADFRTYLPDALPGIEKTITISNLLTHTGGIRDIYDLWALTGITWYERPFRNRDAIALLNRQTDLNFAPGSDHLYSNSNYILLAELIAEVSGKPFHEYATDFFAERGMTATSVLRRAGIVVPNLARPYGNWSGWLEYPSIANLHGDGFVYTTLRDQLAWEQQIQGRKRTLSNDLVARSQRPISNALSETYGFGLEFGTYKGLDYVFHIGNTGAYNAYLMRFPAEDTAIVVMGNTTEVGIVDLGRKIVDIILADRLGEQTFPTTPDVLQARPDPDEITGIYEASDVGTIIITQTDRELFAAIQGNEPAQIIHERGNLYAYAPFENLKLVFETDNTGAKTLTLYNGQQSPTVVDYYPSIPSDPSYPESLNGTFINQETDTTITIEHLSGKEFQITKNERTRDGTLIAGDYLGMNNYRIRIIRQDDGTVSGLSVENNRIRNVWFGIVE